jgi:flagellar hook-basal body complex protein FliE
VIVSTRILSTPQIAPIEPGAPRPIERTGDSGPDFGKVLGDVLTNASDAEKQADAAAKGFAAGDPNVGIHEVVIAAEKANIEVRFAVTLKNRAIEAYKELLNTPL